MVPIAPIAINAFIPIMHQLIQPHRNCGIPYSMPKIPY